MRGRLCREEPGGGTERGDTELPPHPSELPLLVVRPLLNRAWTGAVAQPTAWTWEALSRFF